MKKIRPTKSKNKDYPLLSTSNGWFFHFLLQPERMLFRGQGRGLGFTSERKSQTLEKGLGSRMWHPTALAVHVLPAQTGGNPQNGELSTTQTYVSRILYLESARILKVVATRHHESVLFLFFSQRITTRKTNQCKAVACTRRLHACIRIDRAPAVTFSADKSSRMESILSETCALQSIPRDCETVRANSGIVKISGSSEVLISRFGARFRPDIFAIISVTKRVRAR